MNTIQFKKLDETATIPTRAHEDDAGLDLYCIEKASIMIGETKMVKTGIAGAIPPGHFGLVKDRSSLAKRGLRVGAGVIDPGYRGEICVVMQNLCAEQAVFLPGQRIAQLLVLPVATPAPVEVKVLSETERGEGGFGSTGA